MAYAMYDQRSGEFTICEVEDGGLDRVLYQTVGYAGRDRGRNNPSFEAVRNIGPLPRGDYSVRLEPHRKFRAPAFRLHPVSGTVMHGRSGFWIHGDSLIQPGNASHGCIILSAAARGWVEHYQVRHLEVLSGPAKPGT